MICINPVIGTKCQKQASRGHARYSCFELKISTTRLQWPPKNDDVSTNGDDYCREYNIFSVSESNRNQFSLCVLQSDDENTFI